MQYADGGNYRIELSRAVAVCTVWKRPDVGREQGMQFAKEKVELFERLAREVRAVVRAVVLDLREAPTVWGPVTQGCLEQMVATLEGAERRIAIVVSDDPLQGLQMTRIVRDNGATMGQVFLSFDDACTWAREPLSLRNVPKG